MSSEDAASHPSPGLDGDLRERPAVLDSGRTVLGWATTEPINGKRFSKVILKGPYWSGTNAVRDELQWRFHAPVLNPDKLEVCASTHVALQSLCEGLLRGHVVQECIKVGQKLVPKGYKVLNGSHGNHSLSHILQAGSSRHRQPTGRPSACPNGSHAQPPSGKPHGRPSAQPRGRLPEQGGEETPKESSPLPPEPTTAQPDIGEEKRSLAEVLSEMEPPVTLCFGPETNGHCSWWKHAIRREGQGSMDTDDDTLVVLVTKDPLFWLQSMSKHYYEMKVRGSSRRAGLDALFGELQHEGRSYRDAVELWSAAMRSFLDEELYPSSHCVVLRYEDFLFRFWDVMIHLSAFLPVNCQRLKESPNPNRSKSHGREVRGREEALKFYSSRESRRGDLTSQHFERIKQICPTLLDALGYESIDLPDMRRTGTKSSSGLCSWVPALRPGDIVATYFHCNGRRGPDGDAASFCSARRAWARVCDLDDDEEAATVELLRQVPYEWLAQSPDDWSIVEGPAERAGHSALKLACTSRQTVPRSWVDLRLPCPDCTSPAALPLTEEGYRAAVSLRSTPKMGDFISRVISDLEVRGLRVGRVLDRRRLLGFARWFSGEASVQSLAQIRRELPGKEAEQWVSFAPPRPVRYLDAPDLTPPVEVRTAA